MSPEDAIEPASAPEAMEERVFSSAGEWLNKGLLPALKAHLEALGALVPERTRINRGFPPKRGWGREAKRAPGVLIFPALESADGLLVMGTADGYHDVFVNPRISDPFSVATIVLHYLTLAALGVPPRSGGQARRLTTYTRKSWKTLAGSLGFVGRPSEMCAGPRMTGDLQVILEPLGPYPEGQVERHLTGEERPKTRFLKVWCPTGVASGQPGGRNKHFQGRSTEHYRDRLPRCSVCGTLLVMAPSQPKGSRRLASPSVVTVLQPVVRSEVRADAWTSPPPTPHPVPVSVSASSRRAQEAQ